MPALAAASAVAAGMASCVTAPPADVPPIPDLGPTIIQDAVQPSANQYLTVLPAQGFTVPVRVSNPNKTITCRVFVDFDPGVDNINGSATGDAYNCDNFPPALDGGPTLLNFTLSADSTVFGADPTACHVIQCFVANAFAMNSFHTPAGTMGADSVTWQYTPNGPGSCDQFDGGDGAFPPDAPPDGLPLTPDAVGTPR